MADNDDTDESFLNMLERDLEKLEAAARNHNTRRHEAGNAIPDTPGNEIQLNSWLDSYRSVSTSSFSGDTRVVSSPAKPSNIQCYGFNFDMSTSASLAGAGQSISYISEQNNANSIPAPLEITGGDFSKKDEAQSNTSETPYNRHNVELSNWRSMSQKRPRSTNLGADEGNCRRKEKKPAEYFPQRLPTHSDSTLPPQILIERDENESIEQTKQDCRELSIASAMFSQTEDSSNKEMMIETSLLGSVAGPSGSQAQSHKTKKGKPFACDVCGKAFHYRSKLQAHHRTHTGDKPFTCYVCHKSFSLKGNLTVHLLTHTGERAFECEVCGKKFAHKHHLEDHIRTHTGEKPYSCEFCGRKFANRSDCRRHEKNKSCKK